MMACNSFELLCGSILRSNKNIQSVAVISKMGRPLESASKQEYADRFPGIMNELFFMQSVLEISMGKDFDEQFGTISYHISERTNLTLLTFPFGEEIILVTVNKKVSPISIARKISSLILQNGSRLLLNGTMPN